MKVLHCDASNGACDRPATVDFGRVVTSVPGVPGSIRRLCCKHAQGLRGHRSCVHCAAGTNSPEGAA